MLASNNLSELSDLDVLGKFARLTHLVLLENPVTKKRGEWVSGYCCPRRLYIGGHMGSFS